MLFRSGLVVGMPLHSRVSKTWVIPLARQLVDADGEFAGVVYANLDVDELTASLRGLHLGERGAASIFNPRGELLELPEGKTVADYIRGLIHAGRVVVGIEGGESDLAYAIKVAGEGAFMFSSDFPHEVNLHTVRKEINELLEREEISAAAKQAILRANAARFYGLPATH